MILRQNTIYTWQSKETNTSPSPWSP